MHTDGIRVRQTKINFYVLSMLIQLILFNVFRLPIADCRLPIADCRLPIADCRLPIVVT